MGLCGRSGVGACRRWDPRYGERRSRSYVPGSSRAGERGTTPHALRPWLRGAIHEGRCGPPLALGPALLVQRPTGLVVRLAAQKRRLAALRPWRWGSTHPARRGSASGSGARRPAALASEPAARGAASRRSVRPGRSAILARGTRGAAPRRPPFPSPTVPWAWRCVSLALRWQALGATHWFCLTASPPDRARRTGNSARRARRPAPSLWSPLVGRGAPARRTLPPSPPPGERRTDGR